MSASQDQSRAHAAELERSEVERWVLAAATERTIPGVHAAWQQLQGRAAALAQLLTAADAAGLVSLTLLSPSDPTMAPDLLVVVRLLALLQPGPSGMSTW